MVVWKVVIFHCYLNYWTSNVLLFFQNRPAPEDHRRKWDKDEYEKLAQERIEEELRKTEDAKKQPPPVVRELLKPRDYKVCYPFPYVK